MMANINPYVASFEVQNSDEDSHHVPLRLLLQGMMGQ